MRSIVIIPTFTRKRGWEITVEWKENPNLDNFGFGFTNAGEEKNGGKFVSKSVEL